MRRLLVLAACALSAGALTAVADGRPPGAVKARTAALDLRLHVRHAPGDDFFRGTGEARRIGKAKVKYVRAVDGVPGEQAHTWRFRRGTIRATASVANVGGTATAQRLKGTGRITGGTGAYRGVKGKAKVTGTYDAAADASEYRWKGTLRYPPRHR